MSCSVRKPDCPGPYTEDACDVCEKLEGERCVKPQPSKRLGSNPAEFCKGPFAEGNAYICGMCRPYNKKYTKQDWLNLVQDRKDKRAWLGTLNLNRPVQQIYDASACGDITPAEIDTKYNRDLETGSAYDWCPWVRIGNLYTTVTTGNDNGWRLLVEQHLAPNLDMPRDISVFTGRHGNPEGTITKDDRELFFDGIPDPNHYLQDILQKVVAEGHFIARPERERPRIRLWNVGTTAGTTMTKTQQLARERLDKGEIVIFAWCWSLLSFYKVTAAESIAFKKWHRDQAYNKPIKEIVKEKYGWALMPDKMWLGTPAQMRWLNSEWRDSVRASRREEKKAVKKLFPGGITSEQLRDQKETLSKRLDDELYRRPTHNH